jgi:hypothetical protein
VKVRGLLFAYPCHFGDFGRAALRPEQRAAIGEVDMLMVPVGDVRSLDRSEAEIEELLGTAERPVIARLTPPR